MSGDMSGYLLHSAIIRNDLNKFNALLADPRTDINEQTEHGDTPLFLCMAHNRSRKFIRPLLKLGCDVTISNKHGMSPLRVALLQHNLKAAAYLINFTGEEFFNNPNITFKDLLSAIRSNRWRFQYLVMNTEKRILICSYSLDCSGGERLDVHEINAFLKLLQSDQEVRRPEFKSIVKKLIQHSLMWSDSVIFKLLWHKLPYYDIQKTCVSLLYLLDCKTIFIEVYNQLCNFKKEEYIECLCLILSSPNAAVFVTNPLVPRIFTPLFAKMFQTFRSRRIERHGRVLAILCGLKIAEVTIEEITQAYHLYGFNHEVVLLLDSFTFSNDKLRYVQELNSMYDLVESLNMDPCFSLDQIECCGIVRRRCFRKLINRFVDGTLPDDLCEIIALKKQMLNRIPTLYEISKYHVQKCIQKFYKIQTEGEFHKMVKSLGYFEVIEESLCKNPPIYY